MQLNMCTINQMKELSNEVENVAINYYINKFPLKLNTTFATAIKITFEISDDILDVNTICKLIKNNGIALICFDFNNLLPKSDSFIIVNTDIKNKCENKIINFKNIITKTLVQTSTYFTVLNNLEIYNDEQTNKYQMYLGQFNNGLIIQ